MVDHGGGGGCMGTSVVSRYVKKARDARVAFGVNLALCTLTLQASSDKRKAAANITKFSVSFLFINASVK